MIPKQILGIGKYVTMLIELFVYSLPLVAMGISGPTVATLVLFTAFHPVSDGDGHGSGATVSPDSTSF